MYICKRVSISIPNRREGEYNGLTPIDGSKKSPVSGDSAHQTLIGNFTSASPKRGQRREEGWKEVVRR